MLRQTLAGICLLTLTEMGLAETSLDSAPLPAGFVDVADVVPGLVIDLKYLTADNFVGTPVEGYRRSRCLLTEPAAQALQRVQAELGGFGLGLKVFDAYRPQQAVDHFVRWAEATEDQGTKPQFYPGVEKSHLFRDGYIATRSGHSRGSTVDLTLVAIQPGQPAEELDMGTPFDFFGEQSWTAFADLSPQQRANRLLLREIMQKHGFRPYGKEWWHFTLKDEPFPETYFNFPVE